jgi:hypothetical protein
MRRFEELVGLSPAFALDFHSLYKLLYPQNKLHSFKAGFPNVSGKFCGCKHDIRVLDSIPMLVRFCQEMLL